MSARRQVTESTQVLGRYCQGPAETLGDAQKVFSFHTPTSGYFFAHFQCDGQ